MTLSEMKLFNNTFLLQAVLNEVQAELQQIQEGTTVHKRRVQDMLANILRDLSEVGSLVGGNVADMKVSAYFSSCIINDHSFLLAECRRWTWR